MLVIALLIPSVLFAKTFSLGLGGVAMYNVKASEVFNDNSAFTKLENYNFGADVRLKVLLLDVTAMGLYNGKSSAEGAGTEEMKEISGIVTAGLAFDLMDMIRVGVGIGPRLRALTSDWKDWKVYQNGAQIDSNNFGDVLKNAPMTYRAMVDLMLGNLSVGLSYMVDTKYTFNDPKEVKNLVNCDWDSGKLGVSLLFNLQ